jgi:fructose-bisphosphate aldolase, class I
MAHTNINSAPTNLFSTPDLPSNCTSPHEVFLYPYHSPSVAGELIGTAHALVNPRGRGIYATDEAPEVIAGMLRAPGNDVKLTQEELDDQRKRWRMASYESLSSGLSILALLVTFINHQTEYVSGVILYPETLLHFKLAPLLSDKGIIPGVRANGELRPFPNSSSEFIVEGLDGMFAQLQACRVAGARFSKFRVPIACTSAEQGLPTQASLEVQAETLAQYAAISQQAGLVPIVEPDVEFSADADLARSTEVHHQAISLIYARCLAHGVLLEGKKVLSVTRYRLKFFM